MNLKKMPTRISTAAFTLLAFAVPVMTPTTLPAADPLTKPVVFEVLLPEDAGLEVDGGKTQATGTNRRFESPPVAPGRRYAYVLKATWKGHTVTRKIYVDPDHVTRVDFRSELQNPKAEPKVEPKAEAKVEPKPEANMKAEPKTEAKAEPKPKLPSTAKAEPKAEPSADVTPEAKTEAKLQPEPKTEAKAEPKPKATSGEESESKDVLPTPKPESKPAAKAEPKTEKKPAAEVKPEAKTDAKSEPKAEPKVEPKPEPKVEAKVEPKAEPKAEPKPEPKVDAKAETKTEPKPETKADPKPESILALGLPTPVVLKPGEMTIVLVKVSQKDSKPLAAEPVVTLERLGR